MLFAKTDVKVVPGYSSGATFTNFNEEDPILKLTIRVKDSTIILQTSETIPPNFTDDSITEIQLQVGVHSLLPVSPWTGFRMRAETANARANVIAYG